MIESLTSTRTGGRAEPVAIDTVRITLLTATRKNHKANNLCVVRIGSVLAGRYGMRYGSRWYFGFDRDLNAFALTPAPAGKGVKLCPNGRGTAGVEGKIGNGALKFTLSKEGQSRLLSFLGSAASADVPQNRVSLLDGAVYIDVPKRLTQRQAQ